MKKFFNNNSKGFTLIEIIVATAIFVIVMMIAVGAILTAVNANRKSLNNSVIINNLNLTIESMVRDLRTGSGYSSCSGSTTDSTCIQFTNQDGVSEVTYALTGANIVKGGPVGVSGLGQITSDDVTISDMTFNMQGLENNDGPNRILLHISGVAGGGTTSANFNIETVVTSRTLDTSELTN